MQLFYFVLDEDFCKQKVFDDEIESIAKKQKKPVSLVTQGIQTFSRYDFDWARTSAPPVNFVSKNQTGSTELIKIEKA
jgi:hypothetical protein